MFKIQNGLAPLYLTRACPPLTRDRTPYDLRTGMNITVPPIKTTTYQKSFFPSSIKNWNELDKKTREIRTLDTFKDHQKKGSGFKTVKLYSHFSNKAAINHTRLRLGLSGLAFQRYEYNHIDNPKCPNCNATPEDLIHYFIICRHYRIPREQFLQEICEIFYSNNIEVNFLKRHFRDFLIKTLLKGSLLLTDDENISIFRITQKYIESTQRFG
jgi:hypothetical protein